jgi:hypothetical protein
VAAAVEACALERELEALLDALAGKMQRSEALALLPSDGERSERSPPPKATLGASLALRGGALRHPYHAHLSSQMPQQQQQQQQMPQEVFEPPLLALTSHGDAWGWAANQHHEPPQPSPLPPRAPLASVAAALENLRRIEGSATTRKLANAQDKIVFLT